MHTHIKTCKSFVVHCMACVHICAPTHVTQTQVLLEPELWARSLSGQYRFQILFCGEATNNESKVVPAVLDYENQRVL